MPENQDEVRVVVSAPPQPGWKPEPKREDPEDQAMNAAYDSFVDGAREGQYLGRVDEAFSAGWISASNYHQRQQQTT